MDIVQGRTFMDIDGFTVYFCGHRLKVDFHELCLKVDFHGHCLTVDFHGNCLRADFHGHYLKIDFYGHCLRVDFHGHCVQFSANILRNDLILLIWRSP